jgi:uncharacterized OsmC-like protein/pimeloyl-ACP methyl ester carboxylesterase
MIRQDGQWQERAQMDSERVSFPGHGGVRLAGLLDRPLAGPVRGHVLFAHCFTCNKNLKTVANISRALTDVGLAVLRFDFTGLGESGGEFAATGFSSNVADLLAAADYLAAEHGGPELLVGHSLGGAAALMAAAQIKACRAVATIGAPSHPSHIEKQLSGGLAEIREKGEATVDIGGRPFQVRREFLDDLAAQPILERLRRLRRALLVLHAPLDQVVSIDHAGEIFTQALHPKSFVSLDRADHLLSNPADARYAGSVIASWASRYLEEPQPAKPGPGVTARTGRRGFLTPLESGTHALLADEPEAAGGSGLGPSPYDLLSAALASCTSMTLQMYARHKGLALDQARVTVTHAKVHASDCAGCETKTGRIDRFEREIELAGELDEAQRVRLLEIADRCPVHRTLDGEVQVVSRLAQPGGERR